MLTWLEPCYISSPILKVDKIKKSLEKGRPVPGLFVVSLSENPHNLLEFCDAKYFLQSSFQKNFPPIVGLAANYYEARNLAADIIMECYKATNGFDIKEYLKNR